MITSKIYDIIWLRYQKFFEIIRKIHVYCQYQKFLDIFYNFTGNVSVSFDIVYDIIYDITDFLARKAKTPMISYFFMIS